MPRIRYLFSTPSGEIEASQDLLSMHLKTGFHTGQTSSATLGDYFDCLAETILRQYRNLMGPSNNQGASGSSHPGLKEISITSEKCGTFYHVAKAHLSMEGSREADFAVISAIGHQTGRVLERDHENLLYLWENRRYKLVPRPYFICHRKTGHGKGSLDATISVMEWLDGYFEWHFSRSGPGRSIRIMTWQPGNGSLPLPEESMGDRLFELAAEIIAYYFDPRDLRQICLWSNAAGDFVLGWDHLRHLRVRLTTVRQYTDILAAVPGFQKAEKLLLSLLYLFLDMALNIRLDRLNGTAEYFFADENFMKAAVRGFFQGLSALEEESSVQLPAEQLTRLLDDFTSEELLLTYEPLMDLYRRWKRADVSFLEGKISRHCRELAAILDKL